MGKDKREERDIEIYNLENKENDNEIIEDYPLDLIGREKKFPKLTRVETNTVGLPLFTRSKNVKANIVKVYKFDKEGFKKLTIQPDAGNAIPNSADERIFLGICKLHKEQGYNQTIYFTTKDLAIACGHSYDVGGSQYNDIKNALFKMSGTVYTFENIFYEGINKKVKNDKIKTGMFSVSHWEMSEEGEIPEPISKYLNDKRVKEIYKLDFSIPFYSNIIKRGFLLLDLDLILSLSTTNTYKIYSLLVKWRNKESYVKRPAMFIASSVPLSWRGSSKYDTIKSITKSLEELKERKLVKGYKYTKIKKIDDSYFEIFFDERNISIENDKKLIEIEEKKENNVLDEKVLEEIKELVIKYGVLEENMKKLFSKYKEKEPLFILYCINKSLKKVKKADEYIPYFHSIINIENIYIHYKEYKNRMDKKDKKNNDFEEKIEVIENLDDSVNDLLYTSYKLKNEEEKEEILKKAYIIYAEKAGLSNYKMSVLFRERENMHKIYICEVLKNL